MKRFYCLNIKQSPPTPPTIDTIIDAETLYSNNHSESKTASENPQLLNHMQNMTASIKNITAGIRKMKWHMELMEPPNRVITDQTYKANTGKQVSVELNANLQSVNKITANHLSYNITENHPT